MVTQNVQWLLPMGTTFVVTVLLQVVQGYSAIQTGVVFTAATAGIPLSSLAAKRLAETFAQRTLIIAGFAVTIAGLGLLIGLYKAFSGVWTLAPGLLLLGLGLGGMLTPSVNVVQPAFPEEKQGEISELSRAVSNLGSSLGTAIAGTIVVADASAGNRSYIVVVSLLAAIAVAGLAVAIRIPSEPARR
jgi:MFS family permease